MGEHVHVRGGAVEVGEDEGHLILRQEGAVAAVGLAGLGLQIEELHVHHVAEEAAGFRAQLPIHLQGALHQLVLVALGHGVAGGEHVGLVVEVELVHADALGLGLADAVAKGHQIAQDLLAEAGHLFWSVIAAALAHVGDGDEVFIAHGLGHGVAQLDQAVVDVVEEVLVFGEEAGPGLEGLLADGAVVVLHELEQPVDVANLAPAFHLAGGHALLVFGGQAVLLDHGLHQPLIQQLLLQAQDV